MSKKKVFADECLRIVDNATAARLLHRLMLWPKNKLILFYGKRWAVYSREEWADLLACSVHQFDRALAKLKTAGLVVAETHLFQNKTRAHIRLAPAAWTALEDARKKFGESPVSAKMQKPLSAKMQKPESANLQKPYIPKDTPKTDQDSASLHDADIASLAKVVKFPGGSVSPAKEGEVKNGIGLPEESVKQPGFRKPSGVKEVALEWVKLVSEKTKQYAPPLTSKELGQLSTILTQFGKEKTVILMRLAVERWPDFVEHAKVQYGAFPLPATPTIWFFVKWYAALMSLPGPKEGEVMEFKGGMKLKPTT